MGTLNKTKILAQINSHIEDGLVKGLFDRLRNYLICTSIFAIGLLEYKQKPGDFLGISVGDYSGLPIVVIAFFLFILNTYDGIRNLVKHIDSAILRVTLTLFYILFAIRLMELAWKYTNIS